MSLLRRTDHDCRTRRHRPHRCPHARKPAPSSDPGWAKTLLILTYDEDGGYYDHVPPPSDATPGRLSRGVWFRAGGGRNFHLRLCPKPCGIVFEANNAAGMTKKYFLLTLLRAQNDKRKTLTG